MGGVYTRTRLRQGYGGQAKHGKAKSNHGSFAALDDDRLKGKGNDDGCRAEDRGATFKPESNCGSFGAVATSTMTD